MAGPYTNIHRNTVTPLSHLGGYTYTEDGNDYLSAENYNKLVGAVNDVVTREREQFDIRNYGADTSNSGADNRTAILLAIDAAESATDGGEVVIPPGIFLIGENPSAGATNIASFQLNGLSNPVSFRGIDPQRSVLKMDGANSVKSGAWYMFQVYNNTTQIYFRDLVLHGDYESFTDPDEQIHGIQAGFNGAARVYVFNCEFNYWVGDGVRHGGEEATPSSEFYVVNSRFYNNDRSGVGVQRNCFQWHILGNYFYGTNDQDIDFEPTGVGGDTNFIIAGNICKRRSERWGTISITLSGNGPGTDAHARSVFANNVLEGGGIDAGNVQYTTIANNVIYNGYRETSPNPAIALRKYLRHCTISNNTILQESNKPGIQLSYHTSAAPEQFNIIGNTFHMKKEQPAILTDGCSDVVIANNICEYDSSLTAYQTRGIGVDASAKRADRIMIHGNIMKGQWNAAIGLGGNKEFSSVSVCNNMAPNSAEVVEFTNTSYLTGDYPYCTGNIGGKTSTIDLSFVKTIVTGGNWGNTVSGTTYGVAEYQTYGHPGTLGVAATLGSTCVDVTSASGTCFFRRESGGNTNWSSY